MFKDFYTKSIVHLVALGIFLIISYAYFSPLLEGKVIRQSDMLNFYGMSKELADYRQTTGEEGLWSNSMFGGMPSYLTTVHYPNNVLAPIISAINLWHNLPAGHLFMYMLGFYICLLAFGADPKLSIAGAIAFAFSSYFFIIIEAGHVTKAYALGYLPPIIGGLYLAYKRNWATGALLFSFFLAAQLATRHLQITYYTLIAVLVLGAFLLYQFISEKNISAFIRPSMALIAGAILAIGVNFPNLYLINEYGKYSMRGQSELSHGADDKTSGLDKSYATAWSYGIAETGTLLIPNFNGGGASDSYRYSSFYKENFPRYKAYFMQQGYPVKAAEQVAAQQIGARFYWGDQPFTSGPVYIGAIVCMLFILGLIVVPGALKWWLLSITLLSITLSWGKNMMWLTEFFLDFVPGYNKFRTVSMILVIAQFAMPLLGFLGLQKLLSGEIRPLQSANKAIDSILAKLRFTKNDTLNIVLLSVGLTAAFTLFFALFGGSLFDFGAAKMESDQMSADILAAREAVFSSDAWRSLLFILLAGGALAAFALKKLTPVRFAALLAILLIADMWPVNKRYLNDENFVSKREMQQPFKKSPADDFILRDNADKARVLNVAANTFNDAGTSYFHHSIGGYHGAKMKRYQELIDHTISGEMQQLIETLRSGATPEKIFQTLSGANTLNMLNTKYIIYNPDAQPLINSYALGSAWLVENLQEVENADAEIARIATFNPAREAIYDKRFADNVTAKTFNTAGSSIKKTKYTPRQVNYQVDAKSESCAVFSEIYYPEGWNAYIDGKLAEHFRVDYVLRAMILPAGTYQLEFKFEPKGFIYGNMVTLVSSLVLLLLIIGYIATQLWPYFKKR